MYVCIHVYVCINKDCCKHINSLHVCMYVSTKNTYSICLYVSMYVYTCMYVCLYVCMYVCIHVYLCMYRLMYICKHPASIHYAPVYFFLDLTTDVVCISITVCISPYVYHRMDINHRMYITVCIRC